MNRDQSVELWLKGKDAWNEWAEKLLAEKQNLIDAGDWQAEKQFGFFDPLVGKNEKTKDWFARANTDFSSLWVLCMSRSEEIGLDKIKPDHKSIWLEQQNINFVDFIFPGNVTFINTLFDCGNADFSGAQFSGGGAFFGRTQFSGGHANFIKTQFSGGGANFSDAQFSGGDAHFMSAQFSGGGAFFNGAQFSGGDAHFNRTKFIKDTTFSLSTFGKLASFGWAEFQNNADFSSIDSKKPFDLTGTTFHKVPNFTETAFRAPPVLDEMEVKQPLTFRIWNWHHLTKDPRPGGMSIFKISNAPTDTRKYRALAKMASEAKDYQNEMEFFANEQRCRRFWHDKPFGKGAGRFWFGLIYEKTSDFGRNFWRPLAGWLSVFGVFAFLYASLATATKWAWGSALYISFRHGLIFSGLTRSDSWDNAMQTLFGKGDTLDIPTSITWAMAFQPLISAVFIFLFLLALRNQFKIR